MNRNITILVIILVILLAAGYLLWLRNRFQSQQARPVVTPTIVVTPTLMPTATPIIASPSATATPTATPRVKGKTSPTPAGQKTNVTPMTTR